MSQSPGAIRGALRAKARDLLQAGNLPGTVSKGENHIIASLEDLPLTRVRTPTTQRQVDNADQSDLFIELALIHIAAATPEAPDVELTLDNLADAAELILYKNPRTLDGSIHNITPGDQITDIDEDADPVIGTLVSSYTLHIVRDLE